MNCIHWRPWQDKLIRSMWEEGFTANQIASRLGYSHKPVARRMEVLGLVSAPPRPMHDAGKYGLADDAVLLRLHAQGKQAPEIALAVNRSQNSVSHRLSILLAKRAEEVFTGRAQEARDENIYGHARHILKKAGYGELRLKVMSLDEVMHAANGILHSYHYPQLGRKPAWLHE